MATVYSRNAPGDRKFSQPSAIIFLLLTRSEQEFIPLPDEIFANEAQRGFFLGAGRATAAMPTLIPRDGFGEFEAL